MMNLRVEKINKASDEEWDRIWQNCNYATYFHSREWAEIWNKYSQENIIPTPQLITFSDKRVAILPFSYQKTFLNLTSCYLSSPAGTFGGWISTDTLQEDHMNLLIEYIKHRKVIWRMNPYDKLLLTMPRKDFTYDETQAIDLSEGFEKIKKKWTKGHFSAVHKAQRAKVETRVATSKKDWDGYYCIYQKSVKRWGRTLSSFYKKDFFDEIYKKNSGNIKLWLATYQDQIIGGALCLYAKKHVVYWHGAALAEYFDLRPINLLIHDIIGNSIREQYLWFDFNPSGHFEGVKKFKQGFGPILLPCPVLDNRTLAIKIILNMYHNIQRIIPFN